MSDDEQACEHDWEYQEPSEYQFGTIEAGWICTKCGACTTENPNGND